jgi:hypothetical protein
LLEGFEVVFHAQIKRRILRIALAVDGFRHPNASPGCGEKPHAKATRVPDAYSVGRVIIVHNMKGGLREAGAFGPVPFFSKFYSISKEGGR